MKEKLCIFIFLVGSVLLLTNFANATVVTVADNTIYWGVDINQNYMPGWDSSTAWSSGNPTLDSTDHIGHPDIQRAEFTIDNGYLTDIAFYSQDESSYAGDVFIDVDCDYQWDYIIAGGVYGNRPYILEKGIYKVNSGDRISAFKGDNNNYYVLSDTMASGNYRPKHPVYLDETTAPVTKITDSFTFKNFDNNDLTPVLFGDLGDNIRVDDDPFIVAFTEHCANDVFMEKVSVPEPMTLILLGFGLIGIATSSRKNLLK